MCGIAGYWREKGEAKESEVAHMVSQIQHRGPDDSGVWVDVEAGIAFGHRRLSIIDLSPQGHQPMISSHGQYVIAYNGEVYNFPTLRRELERDREKFRGHSDTEVILAAIETWGLKAAVKRFIGMFAFALWDCNKRRLHLVRDRLGIKPLFYGRVNGAFIFASELKAIKAFPGFSQPIDRGALSLLMRHNCVPAPYSIYQDVYKLLPGHILTMTESNHSGEPEISTYWSARKVVESCLAETFTGSMDEGIEQLDGILREAVRIRMVADVPLGAFLSGGYDSSTVVAMMQAQSTRPVKTFTIGFHEAGYNEAKNAKAVAQHLGTEHTELYVTPREAMDVIPKLPTLYDEPFSDSSQIPTFLISQLARHHVTVALSGDGGDELFGGYNRHFRVLNIWQKFGLIHPLLREVASRGLQIISPVKWNLLFYRINNLLPSKRNFNRMGDNIYKFSEILPLETPNLMYQTLCSHWKNPEDIVVCGYEPMTKITNSDGHPYFSDFTHRIMYLDMVTYLPDDILTKMDRASMGVSLEARVPILDHRVVEFAWRLPLSMKIRNGHGKWILRQVLYKYVPKKLVDRPKSGFGIPIDSWLRGPLKEWGEELLDEKRLREEGFFYPTPIRVKWAEHLSGRRNWQYHLWDVLMFQAWKEHYKA